MPIRPLIHVRRPSCGERQVVPRSGQFVAVDSLSERIVGMSASLIVLWDDYSMETSWRDFTSQGTFLKYDADHGRTLYGAEAMVEPGMQWRGIGKKLYRARREFTERLRLLRIRAGARLRGYHRYASSMDPTLSFQLGRDFKCWTWWRVTCGTTLRVWGMPPSSSGLIAW